MQFYKDTSLIRTLCSVPLESVLERFDCSTYKLWNKTKIMEKRRKFRLPAWLYTLAIRTTKLKNGEKKRNLNVFQ